MASHKFRVGFDMAQYIVCNFKSGCNTAYMYDINLIIKYSNYNNANH